MTTPNTLTYFKLDLKISTTSGYSCETAYNSHLRHLQIADPKAVLMEALRELTRIAAVAGWSLEAAATAAEAITAVAYDEKEQVK